MSRWTHIAGIVRIDAMPFDGDSIWIEELSRKLGTKVTFYSPKELWDLPRDKKTPMGSEGGVEYLFEITGSKNSMSRGVVSIYGDLRDFGGVVDTQEIIDWLNNSFSDLHNCFIRQGVVQIEDEWEEGSGIIVWDGSWLFKPNQEISK